RPAGWPPGSAVSCSCRPPRRPSVNHPPRFAVATRHDARCHRHNTHAQAELLAHALLQAPRGGAVVQLDLELDLVHPARLRVEGDEELPGASYLAYGLLDRRGVNVHPTDDHHVVSSSDDPPGEPPILVAGR